MKGMWLFKIEMRYGAALGKNDYLCGDNLKNFTHHVAN